MLPDAASLNGNFFFCQSKIIVNKFLTMMNMNLMINSVNFFKKTVNERLLHYPFKTYFEKVEARKKMTANISLST